MYPLSLSMPKTHPLYLAGSFCTTNQTIDVINNYDNSHIATVAQAGPDEIEQATAAAVESFHETKQLEPYQRREILEHITHRIQERSEEFARSLTLENGKTINESRGEVQRCIATFQSAIGECERIYGDHLDCGVTARGAGRRFVTRKFPIGPVAAISPFNFPLNLSAHKIAPAIATGCPIVLKHASKTPLNCLLISEIID